MKRPSVAILLILVLALHGCGGAGNQTVASSRASKSGLTITVHWPARTRLVPILTQSIAVNITPQASTTPVSSVTITAPNIGQPTTTVNVLPLPIGTFVATATADATGSAPLATGTSQPFTTSLNQTSTFTVDMTTTIDHLAIPGSPTVAVGATVQLVASGVDANGNTILVSPANLSWSSLTPNYATVNAQSAVATGVAVGSATITVTDNESGKSGQGTLAVTNANGASIGQINISFVDSNGYPGSITGTFTLPSLPGNSYATNWDVVLVYSAGTYHFTTNTGEFTGCAYYNPAPGQPRGEINMGTLDSSGSPYGLVIYLSGPLSYGGTTSVAQINLGAVTNFTGTIVMSE